MAPRKPGDINFETRSALLSLAGVRQVTQAQHSATAGVATEYAVVTNRTKRAIVIFFGNDGDIRFNYSPQTAGGTTDDAVATDLPVLPSVYFVVDCEEGDELSFFNTTGGDIDINIMEIE